MTNFDGRADIGDDKVPATRFISHAGVVKRRRPQLRQGCNKQKAGEQPTFAFHPRQYIRGRGLEVDTVERVSVNETLSSPHRANRGE
ncbi:hypothetical protein NKG95_02345 [Mesorhizobium sp. M1423]|uniref:hypothetical protein n=1 Tax=unclassified Mesorhizobium TaxID=325217 RepID=UPI003338236E